MGLKGLWQKRRVLQGFVGLLALLPGAAAAELVRGVTWDWQLQAPLDLGVAVEVLALDPEEVTAAQVAALGARGVYTICYVSVGTLENWRADAGHFPRSAIGRAYAGWEEEHFLDIRHPAVLAQMGARIARCAEMGFDAVEPDNMDLHHNDTGFGITPAQVIDYFGKLAAIAREAGLDIGQKNAPDLTGALIGMADFVITEGCIEDGWCDAVAAYPAAGKAVLAAEYVAPPAMVCAKWAARGYSVIVKTHDLTRARMECGP